MMFKLVMVTRYNMDEKVITRKTCGQQICK